MTPNTHAVVRTDNMSGTDVRADLITVRMYDSTLTDTIDADNGLIAEVGALETGEREVRKAKLASSSSTVANCVLIANPEVSYDDFDKNLSQYYNEAGKEIRGYKLKSKSQFAVTSPALTTVPVVGDAVGIGANGKIDKAGSNLGTVIAIETVGALTYYVIEIA